MSKPRDILRPYMAGFARELVPVFAGERDFSETLDAMLTTVCEHHGPIYSAIEPLALTFAGKAITKIDKLRDDRLPVIAECVANLAVQKESKRVLIAAARAADSPNPVFTSSEKWQLVRDIIAAVHP